MAAVGIDVGARTLTAVGIGRGVRATEGDLDHVLAFCEGAVAVAVDAPDAPSSAPHADDPSLEPKWRTARCCEIAGWREHGFPAVPWTTPPRGSPTPAWMLVGFALWDALRAAGHAPLEVYPAACFWLLNGRHWPPRKSSPSGRAARLELLRSRLFLPDDATGWNHDRLDAAVAALVAIQGRTRASRLSHHCSRDDGSALWVPAS